MSSISISGTRTTINTVVDNKRLAEFFRDIPEGDARVEKFTELLDAALAARSAFLVDLETQTMKRSVDNAIDTLEEFYEQFKVDLQDQLTSLADPEDGQFAKTFKALVDTSFSDLLNPNDPAGNAPITKLRQHADSLDKSLRDYIEPLRQKLGIGGAKKDRDAGDNFESLVSSILEKQSVLLNDKASRVGAKTEVASTRKIGDLKIELDKTSRDSTSRAVLFEMKTDKDFKSLNRKTMPNLANEDAIRKALTEMMEVTLCDSAVFILDDEYLDMEHQVRWRVLGDNQLLIVVDRLAPDEDYIQLAYAWARWHATRAIEDAKEAFDFSEFEQALKAARDGLDDITNIHTILGRSIEGINESKERLNTMRTSIKSQINTVLDQLIDEEE